MKIRFTVKQIIRLLKAHEGGRSRIGIGCSPTIERMYILFSGPSTLVLFGYSFFNTPEKSRQPVNLLPSIFKNSM